MGASWDQQRSAQLPTIELQSLSRQAAQLGEPFSLKLSGARLEELSDLLLTDLNGQAVNLHCTATQAITSAGWTSRVGR